MMLRRQNPHAIERDVIASDAPRKASSPAGVDTVWGGSDSTVVTVRNRAHSFVADHAGRVFSSASHILWHFQMPLVFILYNVHRVWKACGEIW